MFFINDYMFIHPSTSPHAYNFKHCNTAFSQDAQRSRGSRFAWSGSYNVTMYHNKFVFAFSFPQMKEKKVRQTMGKLLPLLLEVGLHCWTLVILSNSQARHTHHHARENRAYFIFIH